MFCLYCFKLSTKEGHSLENKVKQDIFMLVLKRKTRDQLLLQLSPRQ